MVGGMVGSMKDGGDRIETEEIRKLRWRRGNRVGIYGEFVREQKNVSKKQ